MHSHVHKQIQSCIRMFPLNCVLLLLMLCLVLLLTSPLISKRNLGFLFIYLFSLQPACFVKSIICHRGSPDELLRIFFPIMSCLGKWLGHSTPLILQRTLLWGLTSCNSLKILQKPVGFCRHATDGVFIWRVTLVVKTGVMELKKTCQTMVFLQCTNRCGRLPFLQKNELHSWTNLCVFVCTWGSKGRSWFNIILCLSSR